jgi:uncharacterized protein
MNKIEISDREKINKYFRKYPPQISELTFTNLFAWSHKYSFKEEKDNVKEESSHLIIGFEDKYLQPVGPNPVKKILEMKNSTFVKVDAGIAKQLNGISVKKQRDEFDYVYDIQSLIDLSGGDYVAKRNFVKRFEKNNPCVCVDLSKVLDKCLDLQSEWCNMRDCDKNPGLAAENRAIRRTLMNFSQLELFGVALIIDGKVVGFAIGEPLNDNTFVEHYEKADTKYTGVYQFLLCEFAKRIPKQYKYLNREQDLGIAGIRKAKKSYHPVFMVEKYSVGLD